MRICKELSVQVPKNDLCKFRSFGHVDTTNLNTKELTRMYTDGTNESASLVEGPTGFAVATIRGIVVTTEVPNIMLAQKMKIMKKPCGAETKKGQPLPSRNRQRRRRRRMKRTSKRRRQRKRSMNMIRKRRHLKQPMKLQSQL